MMPRHKKEVPTYEQIVADCVRGCGLRTSEMERLGSAISKEAYS
ncbi:hypothetical protein KSB_04960 [Ktedonobacter robiniae]|uniref:Uncharacterized protein n=1 Tax=Ktedonobacter robiniae TaxID=2778365 RepID=A0ABQ3UH29_9CHLR|nr:hypothetical protein KSB_04960 [Ktedonobacter robiniae]